MFFGAPSITPAHKGERSPLFAREPSDWSDKCNQPPPPDSPMSGEVEERAGRRSSTPTGHVPRSESRSPGRTFAGQRTSARGNTPPRRSVDWPATAVPRSPGSTPSVFTAASLLSGLPSFASMELGELYTVHALLGRGQVRAG